MLGTNFFGKKSKPPRLSPPCKGWVEDLDFPEFDVFTSDLHSSLRVNNVSEVYLEIGRPFAMFREVMGLLAVAACIQFLFFVRFAGTFFIEPDMESVLFFLGSLIMATWAPAICFRFLISVPRDNPIRFNRARQKIYAYNTNPNFFLPWRACPVDIAIYDWSQVRGEYFLTNTQNFSGEGIMLSIVKPGTNEVIDRFPLRLGAQNDSLWNYICIYMQHGPSVLPDFHTPRDANEVSPYGIFAHLAQKVKWPADIDRESITAPSCTEA